MEKINTSITSNFLTRLKSLKVLSVIAISVFLVLTLLFFASYQVPQVPNFDGAYSPKCNVTNKTIKYTTVNDNNNSIFVKNDLSPKQMWIHNSNKTYEKYFDLDFAKDCGIPYKHSELFDLMKFWVNLTATYDIPWWLCYGSLIGAIRHKDMVPWDSDIDIALPAQFESLIRNLSTPRKEISDKKVNIVTRLGAHCPNNAPRMDCQGNIVDSQVDGCAFCGPLSRIFFSPSKRIDLYLIDITFHQGHLQLSEEGIHEYTVDLPYSPVDWYLPLRNCSFMGLTLQCPRKSEVVLKNYYKTVESYYKCDKGKWELIKKE